MKEENKIEYNTKKTTNESFQEIELFVKKTGPKGPQITSSDKAAKFLKDNWAGCLNYRESFYALYLNQANEIIGKYLISQGGISATVVDCRLVFAGALKIGASALIVSHNHPSGNLKPSEADKNLTKKLVLGGKYMDIAVLDHIIVTDESYTSFSDEGLM